MGEISSSGVVVDLKVARRERRHHDDRARQVTVAFVAAATAEISRTALARASLWRSFDERATDGKPRAAEEATLPI
jgi:hypothetical protein